MAEITTTEAEQRRSTSRILDVREDFEVAEGIAEGMGTTAPSTSPWASSKHACRTEPSSPRYRSLPQRQPQCRRGRPLNHGHHAGGLIAWPAPAADLPTS